MALDVTTKSPAPYQTLVLPQDTQEEEEVVSLASGFDNEVDPFAIEQPVVQPEDNRTYKDIFYETYEAPATDSFYGLSNTFRNEWNEQTGAEVQSNMDANDGMFMIGGGTLGGGSSAYGDMLNWIAENPGKDKSEMPDFSSLRSSDLASTQDQDVFIRTGLRAGDTALTEELASGSLDANSNVPYNVAYNNWKQLALQDSAKADEIFGDLTPDYKKAFYHKSFKEGTLSEEQYINNMADAVSQGTPHPVWVDDGNIYTYKMGNPDDPESYSPSMAVKVPIFEDEQNYNTFGSADKLRTSGKYKKSFADFALNNPVTSLAAALGGPIGGLILATGKLANGQTLHGSDYASIALGGMEMANIMTAPVDAAAAAQAGTDAMNAANAAGLANAMEIGNAAQAAATAGTGLLGLGYNASKALVTGVATGDAVEAITTAFGPAVVKKAIDKLGVGDALNTFASNNNINADDLNAGINKTIKSLAKGDDIEDALLKGVGKYVTEGGTILPDAVEDALKTAGKQVADLVAPVTDALSEINKNYIKPVTSEVGDVLSAVDTEARGLLSAVDDKALQPLTRPVGDVLSTADTAARQGLSTFDDAVLNSAGDVVEDVGQAVGDVVEDVGQAVGDVAEDVGQAVGDVLSVAETAVRQVIGDIDLPDIDIDLPDIDIDLPDLDLPDIDLPDIDLPDIDLNIPQVTSAPSPTRTTGGLFDVAQFEHDEGISLVGNLLTGLTEQDAKKLSKKQFQQPKEETVDLLSNPFSSSFN